MFADFSAFAALGDAHGEHSVRFLSLQYVGAGLSVGCWPMMALCTSSSAKVLTSCDEWTSLLASTNITILSFFSLQALINWARSLVKTFLGQSRLRELKRKYLECGKYTAMCWGDVWPHMMMCGSYGQVALGDAVEAMAAYSVSLHLENIQNIASLVLNILVCNSVLLIKCALFFAMVGPGGTGRDDHASWLPWIAPCSVSIVHSGWPYEATNPHYKSNLVMR